MSASQLHECSSSDTDGEDESDAVLTRNKRDIDWCGVEDEEPTSSSQNAPMLPFYGNPNFSNRMQLYSRTRHFLAVYPDGSVRGTQDQNDLHTYLELTNAGEVGDVKIQGLVSHFYVAMNTEGLLYSTDEPNEDTVFHESVSTDYKFYISKKFMNEDKYYYVGIKKSGKPKPGPDTTYLELKNAGPVGYVRILGLLTRLYIAMDKQGRLYAENNMWIDGTVFIESLSQKGYKTYGSSAYPNWYLGIKRSGKFKKGPKTGPNQKAVQFLSVRTKFQ